MKIIGGVLALVPLFIFLLYTSRPQLTGDIALSALGDTVVVRRDALGHTTIEASSRLDLARATGFVHAQERFLSMDLRRRLTAGDLASLLGPLSLDFDRNIRIHGFREQSRRMITELPPQERQILEAYTDGVNQGLATLGIWPFPYSLVAQKPRAWLPEDSLLTLFAMHLVLQGSRWQYDATVTALTEALGPEAADFLAPTDSHHNAALDGSAPSWQTPHIPPPEAVDFRELPLELDALSEVRAHWERERSKENSGSSAAAVQGVLTEHGGGLLANDMHLVLQVPNIWYRVHWKWQDGDTPRMASGLSLPGMPWLVAGSNGQIAWGFTNSNVDSQDLITLDSSEPPLEEVTETYEVAFYPDPEPELRLQSRWGPVVQASRDESAEDSPVFALRWASHWLHGRHINFSSIEAASTVDAAMTLFQRSAIPAQNILIADCHGNAGWTVAGQLFHRNGFRGRTAVSSAQLAQPQPQWLTPDEYPRVLQPRLWSGNQRHIGGEAFARLGDGRYTASMRARQIKTRMLERDQFDEAAMFALQVDARADYLVEWHKRMERILDHPTVADLASQHAVREILNNWDGYANIESVGYGLVRNFRKRTHELFLRVLLTRMEAYPHFHANTLRWQLDGPLTRLIEADTQHFLPQGYAHWDDLMAQALHITLEELTQEDTALDTIVWGEVNRSEIQHPLSLALPALSPLLDPPAYPQAGDLNIPRVARPRFGASQRMVVAPCREEHGIMHMPGGQSGHPLSPFYLAGHEDWALDRPSPFLPGPDYAVMTLSPAP